MDFKAILEQETKAVNKILEIRLGEIQKDSVLREAMEYSVLSSGKRIRPILLRHTYTMLNKDKSLCNEVLDYCTLALELVHCYSLVHDDLPSMDDSDLRRGLPTVHKKFSEGTAVLTGDALLNTAMEFVLKAQLSDPGNKVVTEAGLYLFSKSGIEGMIKGQVIDLDIQKKRNEENLILLTKLKTCALMEASMMMGAALAGKNKEEIRDIEQLAEYIGMIFQIQDDILDYEADLREDKLSFATFYGIEKSEEYKNVYKEKAVSLLEKFDDKTCFFKDLIHFLCNRKI